MSVTRIHEDPRVTLPYTDEQWQRIEALGHQVDEEIRRGDIRLTMGGEPTFVSIDNMDGAEWNTAALGSRKAQAGRASAGPPARALRPRRTAALRPGQMVSGRAAAALGADLLLAHRRRRRCGATARCWRARTTAYKFGPLDAQRFCETLARRLGVDPEYVNPAFEDPVYYLQRERQLPINVDPVDNHLEDPSERERVRRVFERGLEHAHRHTCCRCSAAGPQRTRVADRIVDAARPASVSGAGRFAGRPAAAAAEPAMGGGVGGAAQFSGRPDGESRPAAGAAAHVADGPGAAARAQTAKRDRKPELGESAPWIVRTALCVEPRDGRLHVFMPPLERPRITSICWPRSKTPPRIWRCRW